MNRKMVLIVLGAVIALILAYAAITALMQPAQTPRTVTYEGRYVCLPHKVKGGIQTLLCQTSRRRGEGIL